MQRRQWMLTVAVALVTAAITAGAPSIAATFDAHNAENVDGLNAVKSSVSTMQAAGRLVAHNSSGVVPKKFLPQVGNAETLDGLDASAFALAGASPTVFLRATLTTTIGARAPGTVSTGEVLIPMPSGDWTQVNGRLEQFVTRSTIVTEPASCTPDSGTNYTTNGGLQSGVRVTNDAGAMIAGGVLRWLRPAQESSGVTALVDGSTDAWFLWGVDGAPRHLVAAFRNDCVGSGQDYDVKVEVIGLAFS